MLGIFPALHRKPGALRKANVHTRNHNKAAFPCAVMGNEFSAYRISAGYCLEGSRIFLFLHQVNNSFLDVETCILQMWIYKGEGWVGDFSAFILYCSIGMAPFSSAVVQRVSNFQAEIRSAAGSLCLHWHCHSLILL